MLCKYSWKFHCILAIYFSHLNYFPKLNFILVNIPTPPNSSDEIKRTTLMCKRRMLAQPNPMPVICCCLHCWHPSKPLINNDNYLKKDPQILPFPREYAFPRHGHKPFTLCTNMGNLLLCAKPPSIPFKSCYIHLCVCLHRGTSCIIKMQTLPGWRRDSKQSLDVPLVWGKGYVLVRTWG